ncbi:hypothetical protein [Oceanirhabdus sp. W0125-5]|uniref:hypothetical protein n=1 Tax=Oceanirhabdus sp. W0125-5 TaxID=2999116 RepID=UPI0022F2B6F1|nr:hypothetical protein [Oceanirhabdus sp. W0125-5]WBW99206.1 hypothetical protein OW730_10790 [Oceanirhabdus sp. W0125-5]
MGKELNVVNLDEKYVLNYYLKLIDEDKIKFLSGEKVYKEKIVELIRELIHEEKIHNKIEIAKKLWKYLFYEAMSFIDDDKKGYDDLFEYFDEYVRFEELIFASDAFYRDHTLHSLWVYFLGEYIVKSGNFNKFLKDFDDEPVTQFYNELIAIKDSRFNLLTEELKYLINSNYLKDSQRCISALTHDLGYPLKKINKINNAVKGIAPFMGMEYEEEFSFSHDVTHQYYIEKLLEILPMSFNFASNKYECENRQELFDIMKITKEGAIYGIHADKYEKLSDERKDDLAKILNFNFQTVEELKDKIRFSRDFENFEHGIMSAYILSKMLRCFTENSISWKQGIPEYGDNIIRILGKYEILQAISNHTSKGYKISGIDDVSSLLLFVDEIEEFSRITKGNKNREFINEFCKTQMYADEEFMNIDFIFDNKKIQGLDPKRAFKERCKILLRKFDISNLKENLKIRLRCLDRLEDNENEYEIIIETKFVRIMVNGVEQYIPEYLNSNEFYSREEYMEM